MKRFSFLCVASLIISFNYAQGLSLLTDDATTQPLTNTKTQQQQPAVQNSNTKGVTLYGGIMNPVKGGNTLLPKARTSNTVGVGVYAPDAKITPLSDGNYVGGNGPILFQAQVPKGSVLTVTTTAPKTAVTSQQKTNNNNSGNAVTNNSFPSLTDDNNSLLVNSNSSYSKTNSQNSLLAPLTDEATIPVTSSANNSNNTRRNVETVAPSLMNSNKQSQQTSIKSGIPALASLGNTNNNSSAYTYSTPKFKMPALASIDTKDGVATTKSSMPELAPIDGQVAQTTNKNGMPELAPIEDENAAKTAEQARNPKIKTDLRGLIMPVGTTMKATNTRSFIFKPAVPVAEEVIDKKDNTEEQINMKPSAGGGMGMPALTPIVEETKKNNIIPELAPIENNTKVVEAPAMPALAPIKEPQQQYQEVQYQQVQPQQKVVKTNYLTKQQQLQQAAKNHQHDPNNPCCQVQMYNAPTTKKNATKKPVIRKKKRYVYQQPVQYIYIEEDPQQTQPVQVQTNERIVYVPVQPQQKSQPTQQINQVVQQSSKPQQKVVYKTYTNAYSKLSPTTTNTCNCPNQQQSNAVANQNYNDGQMQYAFYVNTRGKYSVGVSNNNCSIFVGQNGRNLEYKINGDANNTYRPRLNYFGSPENIAGVAIEYNENRTVHKIGNVVFTYDFEDYFLTVGNSNVFYTSRSSLARVDNINVHYDQAANVSSVDQNNGLIQFNP